jgi:hypothetical protein
MALAMFIQNANRVFLFKSDLSKMNPMKNVFFNIAFSAKGADSLFL